ncbi:MAG: MFS transporter [Rhodospirillales bacterium]|nr:MFS transporter [Rhodospirillales bacterium]
MKTDPPGAMSVALDASAGTSISSAIAAGTIGTFLEWYDFFIYGTAAALIFGKLFFPTFSPLAGILASYATYALGFGVRPIGALIFSHLGDKIGRRPVMITTLLMMGLSTALIGLLPTYNAIGIWAPILLLVLRTLQGFGTGAEYSGALTMVTEFGRKRTGFFGAFPPMTADLAILVSSGVFVLVGSFMSSDQFMAWGWRIPFLLAVVGLGVGQYLRLRVGETPDFQELLEQERPTRIPLQEVIQDQPKIVLIGMGVSLLITAGYLYQVWSLTYLTVTLHMPRTIALNSVIISAAIGACSSLIFGALSDKLGWRPVMLFGAIFSLVAPFPFFWLLGTRDPATIYLALTVALVFGQRPVYAVQPKLYHSLFPARLRFTGIALSREIVQALVAGTLPFIATALVAIFAGSYVPVAILMTILAVLTTIALIAAPSEPAV